MYQIRNHLTNNVLNHTMYQFICQLINQVGLKQNIKNVQADKPFISYTDNVSINNTSFVTLYQPYINLWYQTIYRRTKHVPCNKSFIG